MILKELIVYSHDKEKVMKRYEFNENGLNIILGQKSINNDETNGVGKTTMVECIEFLLGKNISKHYELNKNIVAESVFIILEIETEQGVSFLGRHFNTPKKGYVLSKPSLSFDIQDWSLHSINEYKEIVEKFVMSEEVDFSFAALREYIIRNEKTGFNDIKLSGRDAIKTYSMLAFLFGFPHTSEQEINLIKKEIDSYKLQIKLIDSIGIQIDNLKMREDELNREISDITSTIKSFDVSTRLQAHSNKYSETKHKINKIRSEIFELEHISKQYQKNIDNLSNKTKDIKQLKDVEPFFEQMVGYFPYKVRKNYEEIEEFYDFMVDNRGKYFKDKINSMQVKLNELNIEKAQYERELKQTSQMLKNVQFIEDMASVMKELEDKQLELAEIRIRISEYNKKNSINDKINALETEKLRLTSIKNDEFNTYNAHNEYLENLFNQLMLETYTQIGVLNFEYENSIKTNLATGRIKIRCSIPDENSHGRQYMKINMFDLTWLIYRVEHKKSINFLIHDGSYSKPDVAVKPKLLKYIDFVLKNCKMGQYFITINIDELLEEDVEYFNVQNCIVATLDRNSDENRFFGFKF